MAAMPWSVPDPEAELAGLVKQYARRGFWFHRHPLVTLRALLLLLRLPVLVHRPSKDLEGSIVAAGLQRNRLARFTLLQQTRSVLTLPEPGEPYNEGREMRTQRRKARAAVKLGVTTRQVTSPAEQVALLEQANAFERINPRETYRVAEPDNRELLDIDLWMLAEHEAAPVLLAVVPTDGEFATLRYFRTMTHTDASSAARYLLTEKLAEELASRKVRYLSDRVNPFRLHPGVFHFARMVGFRMVRVRLE